MQRTRAFLLSTLTLSACATNLDLDQDDLENESSVEASTASLYREGTLWPNGTIPVCWSTASQARTDFAEKSNTVKNILNASWPAFANIEFTGWGGCGTSTGGQVVIQLNNDGSANADTGYAGASATHTVNLGVSRSDFYGGLIPHEFGHILGYGHEMRRPDFVDDASGSCRQSNGTSTQYEGTPADRQSVMASTGYCQNNPLLSRWDIVGIRNAYGTRSDNVIPAGSAVYARKRSTGDIYIRSGGSWTKVGGPGGQFMAVGSTLYATIPDGNAVWRYSGTGTSWTNVGGAAKELVNCAGMLCATNDNGDLYRRDSAGNWSFVGSAAAMYASTSSTLYRLTLDRQLVQRNTSGSSWQTVGGAASAIYATTTTLYAIHPPTGNINQYSGSGTTWTTAGGPGRLWVGAGSTLYGLTPTRDSVHRYDGAGSWTQVGVAADWIYGGTSTNLYATHPVSKDIFVYNGSTWTSIGQP